MNKLLDFLSDQKIQSVMAAYAQEDNVLLLRKDLEKHYTPQECIALCEQIVLRKKALQKFPHAQQMLFDREGLEQATHPAVAQYHASLFSRDEVILDICSGIGSDAIAFSKTAKSVISLDTEEYRSRLAAYNVSSTGNSRNIVFVTDRFETYDIPACITAWYADPSRRTSRKRIISPEEYSPQVSCVIQKAREYRIQDGKCLIKVSPACDYGQLLDSGAIEVVSMNGEVKEILFILSEKRRHCRSAVLLNNEGVAQYRLSNKQSVEKRVTEIGKFIIEPDNAIIRAGLVEEFADEISASFLDESIAYLTSDTYQPCVGMRAYCVEEVFDYNLKKIRAFLRDKKIEAVSVKKRGLRDDAQSVMKKLGISSGSNTRHLVVYRTNRGHMAALCRAT